MRQDAVRGFLEPDTFVPEDETMAVEEMDDVCRDLLASSQAYQQGQVPMRETRFVQGKPHTSWRFVDGYAADRYTIVITHHRSMSVFIASVSELPDCMASGVSQEEALANARQAINSWVDTAVREEREIPLPSDSSIHLVTENAIA